MYPLKFFSLKQCNMHFLTNQPNTQTLKILKKQVMVAIAVQLDKTIRPHNKVRKRIVYVYGNNHA